MCSCTFFCLKISCIHSSFVCHICSCKFHLLYNHMFLQVLSAIYSLFIFTLLYSLLVFVLKFCVLYNTHICFVCCIIFCVLMYVLSVCLTVYHYCCFLLCLPKTQTLVFYRQGHNDLNTQALWQMGSYFSEFFKLTQWNK